MMAKRSLQLLMVLALAGGGRSAHAASGAEPFDFLFLDANARAVGMGGAYTALAGDANALLYNPAGLAEARRYEATFMHNEYFQGVSQDYIGFAAKQGWGLNLNYVNLGELPRTTISSPGGTGGKFGASDLAVSAGYARRFLDSLSLGAGFKFLRESIDDVSGSGYAVDLGALYAPPPVRGLKLGLALQNLGPTVRFQRADENLPLNLRLGAAYGFEVLDQRNTVSLDVTKERSEGALVSFGAETEVAGVMPVRLGFSSRNSAGPGISVGLGWRVREFAMDYAFVPFGDLGSAHRLSVTARWGGSPEERRPALGRRPRAEAAGEGDADRHFERADEYLSLELFDAALIELQDASAKLGAEDLRQVRYHERLGEVARLKKELSKAKASYGEALRLAIRLGASGRSTVNAYVGMGLCLLGEGNAPYAAKFLRKALEAEPDRKTRKFIEERLRKAETSGGAEK